MTILLRDTDNHNEPDAVITTETLTVEEIQNIIYDMKAKYSDYNIDILTDLLTANGCTVDWIPIYGDAVFW